MAEPDTEITHDETAEPAVPAPPAATGAAATAAPPELARLLAAWLPGQRWFAGKGRPFTVEEATALGMLTERPWRSDVWLVRVRHDDDGSTDTYQVPLVRRPQPADQIGHVLVGETADPDYGGRSWWYDALHDKEVTGAWLTGIAGGRTEGRLEFVPGPDAAELPLEASSLVNPREQSNTSLIFDDAAILKVFRRLHPGFNPDIEVHQALATLDGGERHVAKLLGYVRADWTGADGAPVRADLAMMQEFFQTASDGWELAKVSVRDLYAEADLHANEVGGDFAGEAHRLGQATAEVHGDLARALPTGTLEEADLAELAAAMGRRLDAALSTVPKLGPYAPGLRAAFAALGAHPGGVPVQRVHGDYHLGQVLRTSHRWVVLDFEGEPAKPLSERTGPDSPVRDLAGMLRSFDYAARHLLADHPYEPHLAYRAEEWALRNREAFLDGYAEAGGPDPRDDTVLLRAYEADKAVYEAVYEARNRPSWLPIPLASLARLTEGARP
ncbi:MAG: Maltokinase [uncultured Corynebacteriales bacterium]|uniref:Maltokinase n=1 Tax=uncultured Mycobacteriales bacterium TaxID=581187 RepID=A0A6J4HNL7_9ACTN|nr:MAG: Maltokinase [uncultured Corynebacteriales bacterium]